jgi:predicted membrane-bound dolichyl-phosphate-mannose-protein mannosyltransferase
VALGWTLLHFCWQGTAVAVAYSVIDRMTSRATAGVRYAVALMALMSMPVVVVGTFVEEIRVAVPWHTNGRAAGTMSGPRVDGRQGPVLQEIPFDAGFGG